MDKLEEILVKYDEFCTYLNLVDLDELRRRYPRKELEAATKRLRDLKIRSLPYDLGLVTKAMKEAEFSELLGPHHFPVIRQMDFLSDEEKIALDNYLVRFRVGNFIAGLYHVIDNDKNKQAMAFLLEHGILEERFRVMCPVCGDGQLSQALTRAEKNLVDKTLADTTMGWDEKSKILDRYLKDFCLDCDSEIDYYTRSPMSLSYSNLFMMVRERDASLDNA